MFHHGVSGCESGPEARVCPPRWIEGPEARAGSTPSLAGSEERQTTTKTLSGSNYTTAQLTAKDLFKTVRSDHRGASTENSQIHYSS